MCRLVKFCLVYGFLKMKKNIWNSILFQKQEFSLIVFKSQYCSEIKDNASLAKHDWATSLSFFTFMHWRRKWQSTPVFLPEESQGQRNLVGCRLMGLHCVGHDWSNLAATAAQTVIDYFGYFPFQNLLNNNNLLSMWSIAWSRIFKKKMFLIYNKTPFFT